MSSTTSEKSQEPSSASAITRRLRYILSSVLVVPPESLQDDTQLTDVGVDPMTALLLARLAEKAGLPIRFADMLSCGTVGQLETLVRKRIIAADADVWMEEHANAHPFSPIEKS